MSELVEALRALLPPGVESFAAPLRLALLPLVALLLLGLARRRPAALGWPALEEARAAGARGRDLRRGAALGLRAAAAACLLAVLAEPVGAPRELPRLREGLDLVLALDASGSMRALDAEGSGGWRTRLELAREAVARFARRRASEGDRVALVVFGRRAVTQCPLTTDGALLAEALARVEPGMAGEATALGDALALAVKRALAGAGEAREKGPREPPAPQRGERRGGGEGPEPRAGRLVVLLTDGRSNAGSVPVDVAAGLAARTGTRVHTVGIGSRGEVAMAGEEEGRTLGRERHDLDAETLRGIARSTGGRYFPARRPADLEGVYAEIDRLERVPREASPRLAGRARPEPFLAAAGLLLALEILGTRALARPLP